MVDVAVKPEIKVDGDDGDLKLADIDEFEEDTDLQFPPPDSSAWFARIPSDLWKAWHEIFVNAPDDAKIEVGKMRVYSDPNVMDEKDQTIEILLASGIAGTRTLPQKYTLKLQTSGHSNTVIFSERDLPGHTSRAFGKSRHMLPGSKPSGINKGDRYGKKAYASSIPKQTALAPRIQHEATVAAEIDPETFFQGIATSMKVPATSRTTFQLGADSRSMQPGRRGGAFTSSFTTTSKPLNSRKKVPKEKAVRMAPEALHNALIRCFERYKYWRMRALRKELHQPESYIKSTIERIANLVRSGDFQGCWVLKPEYAHMLQIDQNMVKEEAQFDNAMEDMTDGGTGDELDDEETPELEDVKMD